MKQRRVPEGGNTQGMGRKEFRSRKAVGNAERSLSTTGLGSRVGITLPPPQHLCLHWLWGTMGRLCAGTELALCWARFSSSCKQGISQVNILTPSLGKTATGWGQATSHVGMGRQNSCLDAFGAESWGPEGGQTEPVWDSQLAECS